MFIFGRGYGHDTVEVGEKNNWRNPNTIRLTGFHVEEVGFVKQGRDGDYYTIYDLVIRIKDTGETMTILEGVSQEYNTVEFADGTVWTYDDVWAHGVRNDEGVMEYIVPGEGLFRTGDDAEIITTYYTNNIVYAGGGDDTIYVRGSDLVIYAEAGNDTVESILTFV